MSLAQQIYATHCTFGTSAIERREGEMAERVLGYSARASSLSQADLRKHFRTFERYLSYTLPTDAPSELKLSLDAHTAPKRLVFLPSVAGFQLLGHLSYRTWDTTGKRPGSYFGHLLVNERAKDAAPWSILDCLQLWGAPGWRVEDSAAFPYELDALPQLQDLWQTPLGVPYGEPFQPAVNDEVFLNFLTRDDVPNFGSPLAGFVPARWQAMSAAQRCELFRVALRGYLDIAARQRDNVLLVVEPEMSVLFFYGIARLLPEGELRQAISFSTFEASVDRPATQLVATHFHDPVKTDLRPDRYQRGFALNTFSEGKSTPLRTPHPYADMIVDNLIANGWRAVQETFDAFQAGQGKSIQDLGELVKARELGRKFLDPQATLDTPDWEKSDFTRRYVCKAIATSLAGTPHEPRLKALLQTPDGRALAIIRLLSGSQHAATCDASLRKLTELLPEDQLLPFLEMAEVPPERKTQTLAAFASQNKRLPRGCEILFEAAGTTPRTSQEQQLRPLAIPLLQTLSVDAVRELVDGVHRDHQAALFVCLAEAVGPHGEKQKWLRRLALDMKDEALSSAVERLGERTDLLSSEVRRDIGLRFVQILNAIHHSPAEFATRLTWVKRASRLVEQLEDLRQKPGDLGPSWAPIDRLNAWCLVPEAIRNAKSSGSEKRAGWNPVRGEGAGDLQYRVGKQLAEALSRALPHHDMRSQMSSQDKAVLMHHIIVALGGADLVSVDWKNRAAYYLEYGHWYDTAAPVTRGAAAQQKKKWIFFGVGAGLITAIGTLALLLSGGGEQVAQNPPAKDGGGNTAKSLEANGPKSAAATIKTPQPTGSGGQSYSPPPPPAQPKTPAETDLDSLGDDQKSKMELPDPNREPPVSPASEKPKEPLARPAETVTPPSPATAKTATDPMPTTPASQGNEGPDDFSKRGYFVAIQPEPAPSALTEALDSPSQQLELPKPTPKSIPWKFWANKKGLKVDPDTFAIHGLSEAMQPFTVAPEEDAASTASVSLFRRPPTTWIVRASLGNDSVHDLASFNLNQGQLTLEVLWSPTASRQVIEMQKQLFFCVVEIHDNSGKPVFIGLQPALSGLNIPIQQDALLQGNIYGRTTSLVRRPMASKLQTLFIARSLIILKDGTELTFGTGNWATVSKATPRLPLNRSTKVSDALPLAIELDSKEKTTSVHVVSLYEADPQLATRLKQITEQDRSLGVGIQAANDFLKKRKGSAPMLLSSALGVPPRNFPEFNPKLSADVKASAAAFAEAREKHANDVTAFDEWLAGLKQSAIAKRKMLMEEKQLIEKRQNDASGDAQQQVEEFNDRIRSLYAELFRVVSIDSPKEKDQDKPKTPNREKTKPAEDVKIRVPVMVLPSRDL